MHIIGCIINIFPRNSVITFCYITINVIILFHCQIISYITHQYKYSFASSGVFTCV